MRWQLPEGLLYVSYRVPLNAVLTSTSLLIGCRSQQTQLLTKLDPNAMATATSLLAVLAVCRDACPTGMDGWKSRKHGKQDTRRQDSGVIKRLSTAA